MSKNKECIICGTKYEFCGHCGNIPNTELWRNEYCSEECRQIFKTCARYAGKDITKEEAYNILKSLNVDTKNIQASVKKVVDDVMLCTDTKNVVEETVIETVPTEVIEKPIPTEDTQTSVVEDSSFKRPRRRRTREDK